MAYIEKIRVLANQTLKSPCGDYRKVELEVDVAFDPREIEQDFKGQSLTEAINATKGIIDERIASWLSDEPKGPGEAGVTKQTKSAGPSTPPAPPPPAPKPETPKAGPVRKITEPQIALIVKLTKSEARRTFLDTLLKNHNRGSIEELSIDEADRVIQALKARPESTSNVEGPYS